MLKNTGFYPVKINESCPAFGNQDELLPNDRITKIKTSVKQASKLPKYASEGLKGNEDANFFEFLQLGKIPYWVGGLVLVGCFGAGGKASIPLAKQKAAGVLFYYIAAMAAKALIDKPVKFFKGVDLNRKYDDTVSLKQRDEKGGSLKKSELHNLYESIDFTRWDLLYKNEEAHASANPDTVNEEYNDILLKMGLDKNLNDPDSTVKPYVSKIIVASRAWKSLLTVPLAGLAIGLSTWDGWKHWGEGFSNNWGNAFKGIKAFNNNLIKPYITQPLTRSFVHLWKGDGFKSNMAKKFGGKALILAPLLSAAWANLNILGITYLKEDKYVHNNEAGNKNNLVTRTFAPWKS